MKFKPVSSQVSFTQQEEETLKYWKENKIFERSIESRPADKLWNFLDGPPFITGTPHYGTLLPSILKDIFPRYWTMKGYRVRRVWGWDCHGLPAENKVEQKLGIKRKKDIEDKIGVKKFIQECKKYVQDVSSEWEWYIDHIARWVDFKHAYRTMDLPYMETVMWVFKQMYAGGFIYKGLRISLYCPHCSTPISNFEVAMDADNYQQVSDPGTIYKYKLVGQENTYILAWSTTPWNKLATPALAVNPKLTYIKVNQGDEHYILAKDVAEKVLVGDFQVMEEMAGQKLVGIKFEPHYDFYPIDPGKKAFEIFGAGFVTAEEGTGVVTIAAYGEEDLELMLQENIQIVLHVDEEGKLKPEVPKWAGEYYLDANSKVNADLASRGLIYADGLYPHSVPTCWRCHTRLYYAPQDAWYVNVQKLKPVMEKTNEGVNWFPEHFKYGRFLNSMKAAPDWCISRSRYWGSPVPVWECVCGERYVPGSIAELAELSGTKITDLHKPGIDAVTIKCTKCGLEAHRVPEVLDSWIEAGSAAFAERHYPFSGEKKEDFFPPDFIVEYTGQIRAWFYVLHVIANALYQSPAFKNVAVTGVILGTDGRKMSKNLGNYPDPKEMLGKYGGDALRLYLGGSPVTRGEDMIISEEEYRNQVRTTLLIVWNCFNFFVTYANLDNPSIATGLDSDHVLDRWIWARLKQLAEEMTQSLENYDTISSISALKLFVNDYSTWYIRRSRDRVGPTAIDLEDKAQFYSTCYQTLILFSKLTAPIIPFVSESIYRGLGSADSVHLADWPTVAKLGNQEKELLNQMQLTRKLVELGLAQRKIAGIKVRQPLAKLTVKGEDLPEELAQLIKDELNVKEVTFVEGKELAIELDTQLTEELKAEGAVRELIRQIQDLRKSQGAKLDQHVNLTVPNMPKNSQLLAELTRHTLADKVSEGDKLCIDLIGG